jgi:hypothetical protein
MLACCPSSELDLIFPGCRQRGLRVPRANRHHVVRREHIEMHRAVLLSIPINSQNTWARGEFLFNNLNPAYLQDTACYYTTTSRNLPSQQSQACNVLHARRYYSW